MQACWSSWRNEGFVSRSKPSNRRTPPGLPKLIIIDASLVVRCFKCGALEELSRAPIAVTKRVHEEICRRTQQKEALNRLGFRALPRSASAEKQLGRIRGGRAGVRDLGEDSSLARTLAEQAEGESVAFAVDDREALERARAEGVVTLDFLDLLCLLIEIGVDLDKAKSIEKAAMEVNGWKRPKNFDGEIGHIRKERIRCISEGLLGCLTRLQRPSKR